jgi:hypothetical protein
MSRFDQQYLYEFETVTDPAEAEAGGDPVEPAYAGPTAEEWADAQGRLARLDEIESRIPVAPAHQQPTQTDGFDDIREAFGLLGLPADRFDAYLASRTAPMMAPYAQTHEAIPLAEGEERAMDVLASIASEKGDFDQQRARMIADSFLGDAVAKYGPGPKAAEEALALAAADQIAYEKRLRDEAIVQHTNQLTTLSGVPGEPGSSYSQGVQQRTVPDFRKGGSVAERMFGQGVDIA